MLRITIKNLLARKFRLVLTSVAVMLGVAFMAGTFVLTDTLGNVFDGLFADVNRGVDVAVRGKQPFEENASGPGGVVRQSLDESVLDTVVDVPGVSIAEGQVGGLAEVVTLKNGKPDKTVRHGQAPTLLVTWGPHEALNHVVGGDGRPEVGRRPNAADEVALDEVTAADAGISFRDVRRCVEQDECGHARVQVVPFSQHDPEIVRVVAIFKFGTVGNLAGATLAAFDVSAGQTLLNKDGKFDQITIKAEPGVSSKELRDRVRTTLRDADVKGAEVLTGEQLAKDQSDEIRDNLSFFSVFLLAFALIALFVGAFIIYNTFAIIVAQRTHELGLLRGLGASGRQVTASVTLEALVVGLISSVLGLVVGVGFAIGLQEVLTAFDVQLPSGDTVILARTIIVSVVVGTLVTVLSTIAPARRAAQVSPIAAMQADASAVSSGNRRYVVGGVVAVVGAIALGLGLFANLEGFPGGEIALVGLAAAMVFIGVAMLSPLVARPASDALGRLPERFRGIAGRLARQNATRNPRRTATTAAALMIGIALLTLVAILGSSIRTTVDDALGSDFKAQYVLQSKSTFSPFTPEAANAVREALPGSQVTEFRMGTFSIDGDVKSVFGVDTNLGATIDVHPSAGALQRFRADGGLLLFQDAYDKLPARVRKLNEVAVEFPSTGKQQVPIVGTFSDKQSIGNDYLLAMPDFEEGFVEESNSDWFAAIRLPSGTSNAEAGRVLDRALRDFPGVESQDQQEFADSRKAQVSQFLNLINVLLLFAVIIAVLGVANTLALSIYERTHELGLLRAVGMSRPQVRTMIRYESIIISVFGSALGILLGLLFGRALVAAIESEGIRFSMSIGSLVILVILAVVAGFIAAIFPARRAAHLDVLRAVHTQ